ncbi:hypothetical protein EV401DRAFT_1885173 [Pisolithus croceorrhizus]|nr:hypothetical protein EV401DRAFT_1885173 [Pisolithus croceorrhizus]
MFKFSKKHRYQYMYHLGVQQKNATRVGKSTVSLPFATAVSGQEECFENWNKKVPVSHAQREAADEEYSGSGCDHWTCVHVPSAGDRCGAEATGRNELARAKMEETGQWEGGTVTGFVPALEGVNRKDEGTSASDERGRSRASLAYAEKDQVTSGVRLVRGCGSKDSMDEGEGVLLVAWKTSLYIFGGGCFARRVTERSGEMGLRGARRRGLNGVSRDLHRSSSLRNASAPRVVNPSKTLVAILETAEPQQLRRPAVPSLHPYQHLFRPRRTRASATPATTATTAATGASDSPSMTDQLCRTRNTPHFRHRVAGNHPKNISRTPVLRMKIQRNAPPTHIEEIQPVVAKHRVVPKSVFVAISSKNSQGSDTETINSAVRKLELIEESGFSGSEFELSELDDIPVNGTGEIDYMPPSDEEEVQMMTVSIEISRQTARLGAHRDSGAGLSSGVAPKKAPLGAFNRRSDEDSELSKLTHDESALAKHEDDDDDFGDESAFTATSNKLGRTLTLSERSRIRFLFHHPELPNVWKDLKSLAVVAPGAAHQPAGLRVTLLRFQQESLSWMRQQEESIWKGGILWCRNHVHGMGHTIQMISLSVSDVKRPNLVIGPTVVLMQWRNEIHAHMENIMFLCGAVFLGAGTIMNSRNTMWSVVLQSCFRKQQSGFKRKGLIIKEKITPAPVQLEQGRLHGIKERATSTAKAASSHRAITNGACPAHPFRIVSGNCTVWSITREAIHFPTICTCFWNQEILTPIQKHGMISPGASERRLTTWCPQIQRADDLGLPPRTVIVRRDYFSPEEKELYLSLFAGAKRQFNIYYVHSGTVLNNYSNIFSLITRVRQMACHPSLVLRSMSNGNQFFNTEELGERTVCRLCSDFAEDAIQTKSRHIFDRECIKQYLSASCDVSPKCPIYHLPLTIDLEAPALELAESAPVARQGILGRLDLDTWQSPSKIEALVEELSNLRLQDVAMKRSLKWTSVWVLRSFHQPNLDLVVDNVGHSPA